MTAHADVRVSSVDCVAIVAFYHSAAKSIGFKRSSGR